MIDISDKESAHREAYAAGEIFMAPATLARIKAGTVEKGDVLTVAQVAALKGEVHHYNLDIPVSYTHLSKEMSSLRQFFTGSARP